MHMHTNTRTHVQGGETVAIRTQTNWKCGQFVKSIWREMRAACVFVYECEIFRPCERSFRGKCIVLYMNAYRLHCLHLIKINRNAVGFSYLFANVSCRVLLAEMINERNTIFHKLCHWMCSVCCVYGFCWGVCCGAYVVRLSIAAPPPPHTHNHR